MNGLKHVENFLVFFAIAAVASTASSAEIGQTSRAAISISVTVPSRILVSGVADVEIADLFSRGSSSQSICVLTNYPESTYSVTLDGAEAGMADSPESADVGPASVAWSDGASGPAGVLIARGETIGGFRAASTNTCHVDDRGGAKLTVHAEGGEELALKESAAPLTLLIAPD